jgi:RNA polymerase sigma factor (TIGR02999 family)
MSLVYNELRSMAASLLRREAPGHTLQASALVHEAYLRLGGAGGIDVPQRAYFFGAAARAMRRVLVDHARRKNAQRRQASQRRDVQIEEINAVFKGPHPADLCDVDSAIERLAKLDPRQAQVVEMRFFAGLSSHETADALGVSQATVKRDWAMARAWLKGELQ